MGRSIKPVHVLKAINVVINLCNDVLSQQNCVDNIRQAVVLQA
jgi:hypothetical protein